MKPMFLRKYVGIEFLEGLINRFDLILKSRSQVIGSGFFVTQFLKLLIASIMFHLL